MASRRSYLSIAELEEFADIDVTDDDEGYDRISQAEELIDAYVGPQPKSLYYDLYAEVSAINSKTLSDTGSGSQLTYYDDYLAGAWLEVIGGPASIGETRKVTANSYNNKSITYEGTTLSGLTTASVIRIYQLGKFPRRQDVRASRDGSKYYRSVPEAVRRATAAQVAFMIEMGDAFFNNRNFDMQSEKFLNYSYSRGNVGQGAGSNVMTDLIAPRAKNLLRGIVNRTGRLVEGPGYVSKYPV